ncbi:hypothetical protein C0Z01_16325 [Photobacterium kishitanii]|uniref:hypothetical protein n=2 Tax=Photobacterium kishitanii TaxID=318456 RepID=UPI000432AFA9|nr:hypothetical protein [Photobacterium kishitanii]OBU27223.1 hypothetical protein AYY22_02985 [Photobacterium kishitanii]PSU87120.1 hypothetical protein C0W42_17655 [Photobacterium kishitanii]PSW68171.1 hypothetical protein C0Z01_16325 [Photobacterium kishitanii]CEO40894.1 conserved hypothetical protein [Photobacterium kishitanii]
MDSSEFKSVKREISGTVNDIFDDFEESNSRLPTMEEFQVIIADAASHYLGPIDQNAVDGINANLERQRIREKLLWDAAAEHEVAIRMRRDRDG